MKRAVLLLALPTVLGCAKSPDPYPVAVSEHPLPLAPSGPGALSDFRRGRRPPGPRVPAWRPFDAAYASEHVVKPGDTVSEIAQARLGTIKKIPLLLLANPEVSDAHRISAGQRLRIPEPGYFAGGFLVGDEKVVDVRLLRSSKKQRSALLGVELRDGGPARRDRFLLLEVKGDRARVIFSSSDHRWGGGHFRSYGGGWTWHAVDLDGDGGLDLAAVRRFGSEGACYAYAFHRRGGGHARYVLVENLHSGRPAGGSRIYRDRAFTFTGVRVRDLVGIRSRRRVQVRVSWTGSGFTRREVELGEARVRDLRPARPGPAKSAKGASLK
jgi:hypothetical protein